MNFGILLGYLIGGILGNLIVWIFKLALWLVEIAFKLVWYILRGLFNFAGGVADAARDEERRLREERRMELESMPRLSVPSRDEYMGGADMNRREKEKRHERATRKGRGEDDFFRRLPEADRWD